MGSNNCCYGCENRRLHCHSECEEYKKYRKELEERQEVILKAKNEEKRMNDYTVNRAMRIRKFKGKPPVGKG